MAKSNTPPNGPSKTGNKSGGGRGKSGEGRSEVKVCQGEPGGGGGGSQETEELSQEEVEVKRKSVKVNLEEAEEGIRRG